MGEPTERDELFTPGALHGNIHVLPRSEEEQINTKARWTFWLVVAGATTTIGASLPVGYNIGVVNAPADIIKSFCNESMYTRYGSVLSKGELNILWSAIVSVFLIGGVTGSLLGSWLADQVGRKGAYLTSAILHSCGAILFYASAPANSVEMLLMGRLVVGLAAGLITCTVPMYLTELAPLPLRGGMGVLCPLGLTVGVLVAQIASLRDVLGTEKTWPELLAAYGVLVLIFALVSPFLPESPKYLYVVKKRPQMALKELSRIRGIPASSLSEEIRDLQVAQYAAESTAVSWNLDSVVRNREFLLPILLVCFMQAGQQLSGINAVFYYSVSIFRTAGLNEKECQLTNIGAGFINLMMGVIAIPLMTRCNRRTLFLFSCLTASFWLIVLGLSITFIKSVSWMPYISILAVLSFVLFYGFGLGPIPYFIGSELFEVGPRPSAMALGSMSNWGANFIIGMTFPTMQSTIGPGSFGIFAAIIIALFFFLRHYFPETLGKDPSETALLVKHGLYSRPMDSITSTSGSDTADTMPPSDVKSIS